MQSKPTISLYWKCQLLGWSAAALYWTLVGYFHGGFNLLVGLLQLLTDVGLYVLITHCYRNFSWRRHWQQLDLASLLKRLVPATVVLGMAYLVVTVVKVWLFGQWLANGQGTAFPIFFKDNWLPMFMAGLRLMAIWLLAYHLYYYGRREVRLVKENAQLALIAKDAQLNNLAAQLNPHFLFNSLNTIKALVIENPPAARRAIDLLSDLLRTALYSNALQLHSLQEELALVTDYLELEKLRLEERLQFTIAVEPPLENVPVLRYSLLVLVENAVKHGISQRKQGGNIRIDVTEEAGQLAMWVQHPGVLKAGTGVGLKNLKERLLLHYRGDAGFGLLAREEMISAYIKLPRP